MKIFFSYYLFMHLCLGYQIEPRLSDPNLTFGKSPRIINGVLAKENEFPFAVSLRIVFNGNGFSCGASLISDTWVLTAAHCMYPGDTAITPNDVKVGYGSSNREKQTYVDVKRIINAPGYNKKDANPKNDITLIELTQPINIDNKKTALIKLTPNPLPPKQETTAIGWGAASSSTTAGAEIELRSVNLLVGTDDFCKSISPIYTPNGMLVCTSTDPGGFDTCYGDSGGPLLKKESNGQYSLAGVLSFGDNPSKSDRPVCGDRTGASFFSRPVYFLDFITQNSGLSKEGLLFSLTGNSGTNGQSTNLPQTTSLLSSGPTTSSNESSSQSNSNGLNTSTGNTAFSTSQINTINDNSISNFGAYSTSIGVTSFTSGNIIYIIRSNIAYFNECNVSQSCVTTAPGSMIAVNNYQTATPAIIPQATSSSNFNNPYYNVPPPNPLPNPTQPIPILPMPVGGVPILIPQPPSPEPTVISPQ
ncbi:Transmembrane protease serine 11D [Smittium mucronatum]|uniref:Transmembrane protease serine 11D n=1 Tax=Smittium mucronatum TaxID=133383 RepID=A0A1R0GU38_9FUNG|nr:Transmembrane protease serine 11D [Smittium mucronatum]